MSQVIEILRTKEDGSSSPISLEEWNALIASDASLTAFAIPETSSAVGARWTGHPKQKEVQFVWENGVIHSNYLDELMLAGMMKESILDGVVRPNSYINQHTCWPIRIGDTRSHSWPKKFDRIFWHIVSAISPLTLQPSQIVWPVQEQKHPLMLSEKMRQVLREFQPNAAGAL